MSNEEFDAQLKGILQEINDSPMELTVAMQNMRRDCEIALGLTQARLETVEEARKRVARSFGIHLEVS